DECLRMLKLVDHPNLTFVLDTGQFAGSRGASGKPPAGLANANPLDSIRQMAPLARHVRVKFYNPRPDGSEPWINYDEVFNILRSVHYHGFLDIVYEPGSTGDEVRAAMPRIVRFLRGKTQAAG
ncbi:MAG: sugar phosphate isomerase/epimerase family protein, partial [Bryobacteraceae bacterium]